MVELVFGTSFTQGITNQLTVSNVEDAATNAMPNRRVDAFFTLVSLILQVAWVNGCSPMLGPVMDPRLPLAWPGPHPEAPHRGLQGLSDS